MTDSDCKRELARLTREMIRYEKRIAALQVHLTAEGLAQRFHEIYERLAPEYGYVTREDSRTSWELVPTQNKQLMVETCRELLATLNSSDGTYRP